MEEGAEKAEMTRASECSEVGAGGGEVQGIPWGVS